MAAHKNAIKSFLFKFLFLCISSTCYREMAADPVAEKAAASVLKRAVELDTQKRFTEALVCYQEGLQLLMEAVKAKGLTKQHVAIF